MGRLTTHVLDTASGRPAAGLTVELFRLGSEVRVAVAVTNSEGRLDKPLAEGAAFPSGTFELRFHAGDYLRRANPLPDPPVPPVPRRRPDPLRRGGGLELPCATDPLAVRLCHLPRELRHKGARHHTL